MQGGRARGTPRSQLRNSTMSKALATSSIHPKVEECCDMSFEGLSPELMLCVRIRRERLWCSQPASMRSRQAFRRLVDQTAITKSFFLKRGDLNHWQSQEVKFLPQL